MDVYKRRLNTTYEMLLSICIALRKVLTKSPEDIAYNNALGVRA